MTLNTGMKRTKKKKTSKPLESKAREWRCAESSALKKYAIGSGRRSLSAHLTLNLQRSSVGGERRCDECTDSIFAFERCDDETIASLPALNATKLPPTLPPLRAFSLVLSRSPSVSAGSMVVGGAVQESQRHGCIVLRHYYLGAARAKCLESAIASVPVALREVGNARLPVGSY